MHIEVEAGPVIRPRVAVADESVCVGEHGEEVVDLAGEAVLGSAAGAVEPPHLPARSFLGQGVQHREHRRGADACTHQDHGPIARLEHEGSPRAPRPRGCHRPASRLCR